MDPGTPAPADSPRARLSALRRESCRTSLLAFARTYLAHHFALPPSRMHREIAGVLETSAQRRGARVAVAAPRGHAKSTLVSLAYVLWCSAYGIEKYILLFSATAEQAQDLLGHVRGELASNQRLREDFPDLCEQGPSPASWRRDEFTTLSGVKVTALGADKKVRGRRNAQHRPGLIVLDDLESDQEARSPDMRKTRMEWLERGVLKAGDGATNVVVVGTLLHYDGLLARLLQAPGWEGLKYQAVESWSAHPELWQEWEQVYCKLADHDGATGPEAARAYFLAHREAMLLGTAVLWPEKDPYEALMVTRVREGRASFDAEKQNQPLNPEECLYREGEIVYWDDRFKDEDELLAYLGEHAVIYGACDPSLGKKGTSGDYSAIVTVVRDRRDGTLYVLDADVRRRRLDATIDAVIAMDARRGYSRFGFECTCFQDFVCDELVKRSRAQGREVPVLKVQHSSDKLGRVQRLQPLVTSGGLRFSRRHTVLLEQLRLFPLAGHDDGPDALEMAVSAAQRGGEMLAMWVTPGGDGGGEGRGEMPEEWGWEEWGGGTIGGRRW